MRVSSSLGYVEYEMRGVSCLMAKQSSIKKEDKVERGIGSEQSKLRLSVTVGRDGRRFDWLRFCTHQAGAFFWVKESESRECMIV